VVSLFVLFDESELQPAETKATSNTLNVNTLPIRKADMHPDLECDSGTATTSSFCPRIDSTYPPETASKRVHTPGFEGRGGGENRRLLRLPAIEGHAPEPDLAAHRYF
jgi:hypothetical protein